MDGEIMMLDEVSHDCLRAALLSHQHCYHGDEQLCRAMIIAEVAIRRGAPIVEDWEIEACLKSIDSAVFESLVNKGIAEFKGVDEEGQMMIGLTDFGMQFIGKDDNVG